MCKNSDKHNLSKMDLINTINLNLRLNVQDGKEQRQTQEEQGGQEQGNNDSQNFNLANNSGGNGGNDTYSQEFLFGHFGDTRSSIRGWGTFGVEKTDDNANANTNMNTNVNMNQVSNDESKELKETDIQFQLVLK